MIQKTSRNPSSQLRFFATEWEHRLGITSYSGTACSPWLSGILALLFTVILYAVLIMLPSSFYRDMLVSRGWTQHAAVFFGFWCVFILLIKRQKLRLQRRALQYSVVPADHQFVLSSQTADQVVAQIHANAADPERFLVYNRILTALSNLKNMGRISDMDDILKSLGDRDASAHETSFALINGFLWAIPVLGFIGTVLGLSESIANFSGVLTAGSQMSDIVARLKDVTGGLSTAFETTFVALIIALVIQLWMTAQKTAEETFLDDCDEFCLKQIVSRIRILPYEPSREI
jgi:biopolymer transport protein ExbB/TolQ